MEAIPTMNYYIGVVFLFARMRSFLFLDDFEGNTNISLAAQSSSAVHIFKMLYLSVCLSVCLYFRLSVSLSVCLSVCRSVCLSLYLSPKLVF